MAVRLCIPFETQSALPSHGQALVETWDPMLECLISAGTVNVTLCFLNAVTHSQTNCSRVDYDELRELIANKMSNDEIQGE
jgi:hypothetical protein